MLRHQAFFWLNRPDSIEDREALIAGLRTLAAIPHVAEMDLALPADTEARDVVDSSWSVAETMLFADTASQKLYQDHPVHQAFVERCGHLWSRVAVYDAQLL
jgi:hypothetical protein